MLRKDLILDILKNAFTDFSKSSLQVVNLLYFKISKNEYQELA